ncbi:hypothetical protein Tco_0475455, partial [Tanacetum coccineum]
LLPRFAVCSQPGKTVDDDEVAPRRNKAVPNFQVPDEVEPEDVVDPAEMITLESRLGSLIQHDTITRVPAFKDIHGLALAIVLERLNSHGAFLEVPDKTRSTGTGPTVKTTSKIRKTNRYGSKSVARSNLEYFQKSLHVPSVFTLSSKYESCRSFFPSSA